MNSGNIEVIEGDSNYTYFISVVKFPSKEAALAFEKDEKYAPYLALRKAGTEAITYLIDTKQD